MRGKIINAVLVIVTITSIAFGVIQKRIVSEQKLRIENLNKTNKVLEKEATDYKEKLARLEKMAQYNELQVKKLNAESKKSKL